MKNPLLSTIGASLLVLGAGAGAATAGTIPYPNPGTPNPVTYTFTASNTGDIVAYYYSQTLASFNESVGLYDVTSGGKIGGLGLPNHGTATGTAFDFGSVNAGDTLEFFVKITGNSDTERGDIISSNPTRNADGDNHIYSTSYDGGNGIPAGTYVGFEDLLAQNSSDWNYRDAQFVFTNTGGVDSNGNPIGVPEPASMTILGAGLVALGFHRRRI